MAQTNAANGTNQRVNLDRLVLEACETDDVSLMERAISLAPHPESRPRRTVQEVLTRGLRYAAARDAINVLKCVLDSGADVSQLSASTLFNINDRPSQALLEVLITYGWDINAHDDYGSPLLWMVTPYHDLVVWCLDHGARADIPGVPPHLKANARPTVLGVAAVDAHVETFELLRARNAPLDPRTLHRAVGNATLVCPQEGSDGLSRSFEVRMDMIRHLVDVVKLDVNAVAHIVGSQTSTPLCLPASRPTAQDFRVLVEFLLDRGADPYLSGIVDDGTPTGYEWLSPVACAEHLHNERFLRIVREYEANRKPSKSWES